VYLIKRIHMVAEHGGCQLKGVYREVRTLIGEMLHESSLMIKSMEECRVLGIVHLALMLQDALAMGPRRGGGVGHYSGGGSSGRRGTGA
jgi:hypothetical protein